MANLANGSIEITSNDEGLLQSLQQIVEQHEAFNYEPWLPDTDIGDNVLSIYFTCDGNCGNAWEVFDNLLVDKSFPFQQALIESDIFGSENEECFNPLTMLLKKPGEDHITYLEPLEDLGVYDVWDAFKYLIPLLPAPGSSIDYGYLEELKLISMKVKNTKGNKTTHYEISFSRDGIGYEFSFYTDSDGDVTGTRQWCDESTDDDEGYSIHNETDIMTDILYHYIRNTR